MLPWIMSVCFAAFYQSWCNPMHDICAVVLLFKKKMAELKFHFWNDKNRNKL